MGMGLGWWVFVAAVFGAWILWRRGVPDLDREPLPPGDDDATLVALARGGHRIEAVRRYREKHGCGLKDAKEAVDALREGRVPAGMAPARQLPPPGPEVEALAREGRMVEAIGIYREAYPDVDLAQAKAVVENLRARSPKG